MRVPLRGSIESVLTRALESVDTSEAIKHGARSMGTCHASQPKP